MLSFLIAPVSQVFAYSSAGNPSFQLWTSDQSILTITQMLGAGTTAFPCASGLCAVGGAFLVSLQPNQNIGPYYLDHASIVLTKTGAPSCSVSAGLFAASSQTLASAISSGTSALIASSNSVLCSSLGGLAVTFNFPATYALQIGTVYTIAVYYSSVTTVDASNGADAYSSTMNTNTVTGKYSNGWSQAQTDGLDLIVFADPPSVNSTISNGSYYYSTMFSFFGVIMVLGMIFNRDQPIVKKYGAKAIVILGLALAVMWITGLVING